MERVNTFCKHLLLLVPVLVWAYVDSRALRLQQHVLIYPFVVIGIVPYLAFYGAWLQKRRTIAIVFAYLVFAPTLATGGYIYAGDPQQALLLPFLVLVQSLVLFAVAAVAIFVLMHLLHQHD